MRTLVDTVSTIPVIITNQPVTTTTCTVSVAHQPPTLVCVARHSPSVINIRQLNACSVGNKLVAINNLIISHQLDVLAIVKSWHSDTNSLSLIAMTPPCYRYVKCARSRTVNQTINKWVINLKLNQLMNQSISISIARVWR